MINFNRDGQKIFIVLLSVIVILFGFILLREYESKNADDNVIALEDVNDKTIDFKTQEEEKYIKVYVIGQVKRPGVIEIAEGSRLLDAIDAAGGFLDDADDKQINLAMKVKDEGMYVIPKIGEQPSNNAVSCIASIEEDKGKVNINTANEHDLETLPGIGPTKAKRIFDYREQNGPFKVIEDIKNVSGIGEKTFEGLKDFITVD